MKPFRCQNGSHDSVEWAPAIVQVCFFKQEPKSPERERGIA